MRPRVRSYGEMATITLSPAMTRIRKRRIFPASVATTLCPFTSATRNVVLGSTSETVPSTSMASSFVMLIPLAFGVRRALPLWTILEEETALRGGVLPIANLARLLVVTALAQLAQNAGPLDFLLEGLERPVQSVGVFQ